LGQGLRFDSLNKKELTIVEGFTTTKREWIDKFLAASRQNWDLKIRQRRQ
jgi:hypothetical protein